MQDNIPKPEPEDHITGILRALEKRGPISDERAKEMLEEIKRSREEWDE